MNLIEVINAVNENMRDEGWIGFPRIVDKISENMTPQDSEIDGIQTEWVSQTIDQFDCCHGEIAFKLDCGKFIIFEFAG